MEIGFGAMFLKMVWDTDIYQTMLVVLIITGSYTITGEVTSSTHEFRLTQTLSRVPGAAEFSQSLWIPGSMMEAEVPPRKKSNWVGKNLFEE